MEYRSYSDLHGCIGRNLYQVPADVDLIVGIPRSGLMPAASLAVSLNLPLTDLEGLLEGRLIKGGKRMGGDEAVFEYKKVLVVDDSVSTGEQMGKIRERLEGADLGCEILTAAVFVAPEKADVVDIHFEQVDQPRVFEWNMMNHYLLPYSCVDIDGVLCRDPSEEENDDGDRYREFLLNVEPLHRPRRKIGWLVTSRLEKYRAETEAWMAKHGIEYEHLLMLDLPSKEERLRLGSHAKFKGSVYHKEDKALLFIESSVHQAPEIARIAGKPALCIDESRMYYPRRRHEVLARVKRAPRSAPKKLLSLFGSLFGRRVEMTKVE